MVINRFFGFWICLIWRPGFRDFKTIDMGVVFGIESMRRIRDAQNNQNSRKGLRERKFGPRRRDWRNLLGNLVYIKHFCCTRMGWIIIFTLHYSTKADNQSQKTYIAERTTHPRVCSFFFVVAIFHRHFIMGILKGLSVRVYLDFFHSLKIRS